MSQFDFGVIDPQTKTGTQLADDLNNWRDALNTHHWGAARPTYVKPGTIWVDSSTPNFAILKFYDGVADAVLASLDLTAHSFDISGKQAGLLFKDEGADLGTVGTVQELNFKGGLIKATRAGNAVEVTADLPNAGTQYALRNKIINGGFHANQRAVAGVVTLAAGKYGHDRWKAGAAGCTYSFSTVKNVTTITITAGSLLQIIEGRNLYDGVHVLSWTGTASGRIDAGSYGASGVTGVAVGGTNQAIEFGVGTVANVQYEPGTIPTPFELRPFGLELLLCQRYFLLAGAGGFAYANSDTGIGCQVSFPVEMRAPPAISAISGSGVDLVVRVGGTYETVNTFVSMQSTGTRGCLMYGTGGGYTVCGYHVIKHFAYCDAEI